MIFYVHDNHRSIWHRHSHFHSYKFLFNLVLKFCDEGVEDIFIYIIDYLKVERLFLLSTWGVNNSSQEGGGGIIYENNICFIYLNLTTKLNKNFITVKMWMSMSNRSMIIIYIKYHLQLRK